MLRADELSSEEIAEALDLAPGTVQATLHQARQKLQVYLDPDDKGGSR